MVPTSSSQPSVYFRRKFTVSGTVTQAELTLLHDDGAAVFINGVQVFSKYVGSVAHSAFATSSADNERSVAAIAPSAFVAGENTISVVVKQVGGSSPDLSFDLQLKVTTQ